MTKMRNSESEKDKEIFIKIPSSIHLSWKEQYSHPNWQKKRMMVFARDAFKCTQCGNAHELLHAHHESYEGRFIWDTPATKIKTVCNTCHEKIHKKKISSLNKSTNT